MNMLPRKMTDKQAHAEIRKMYREHAREIRRTALIVRGYSLLIWSITNARKL